MVDCNGYEFVTRMEPFTVTSANTSCSSGLKGIPMDDICRLLDVRQVLVLRRVCKRLQNMTQLHSIWLNLVNEHIIRARLPWPSWALPVTTVPPATLERPRISVIRSTQWWRPRAVKVPIPRCVQKAPHSVTWLHICRSRWLIIQVESAALEFWDTQRPLGLHPQVILQGIEGVVDGAKFIPGAGNSDTLIVSTKSFHSYAIRVHLPGPGREDNITPKVEPNRTWEGFAELAPDASADLLAFKSGRTEPIAILHHIPSRRSVRLAGSVPDETLNLPRAILILPEVVAIARATSLDIYDIAGPALALDAKSYLAVYPVQTLPFPKGWVATDVQFFPVTPLWCPTPHSPTSDIYLVFFVPDSLLWAALIARRQIYSTWGGERYVFDKPYVLYHRMSIGTVASRWGESASSLVFIENHNNEILLTECYPTRFYFPGLGDKFDKSEVLCRYADWSLPQGDTDYAKLVAFEDSTGISAVFKVSGRLCIMNAGRETDQVEPLSRRFQEPHPDPNWPYLHPMCWPVGKQTREDLEDGIPKYWSVSVDRYYPDKNRPDCFGGAKWYANEVLHIQGHAETVSFTPPQAWTDCFNQEIIRIGERFVFILRSSCTCQDQARALSSGTSFEDILAYVGGGGELEDFPGIPLSVDETPIRLYAAWYERAHSSSLPFNLL